MSAQALATDLSAARRPADRLTRLPVVTLYLSERCNSRCISCDYWRHGREDMTLERVTRLLPSLRQLRTEIVLISGGEPLLNPEWPQIAALLRDSGLTLWLHTSGLSLAKHAWRVQELFNAVTVSLDGATPETYKATRGLDAFDVVCDGIVAAASAGARVTLRVTVQRANYHQLPQFISIARQTGARSVSFLAADVANPHAFGRIQTHAPDADALALAADDLPLFARLLDAMEQSHAADFASGFIEQQPSKLRRMLQYFRAVRGLAPFPPTRCNAPEFSVAIDATGHVNPCFFIAGASDEPEMGASLEAGLNSPSAVALRRSIRAGERPECKTCVCTIWRELP
jgi:MoaA/NifB/PqqE/SkfB family radical SAM enzyme